MTRTTALFLSRLVLTNCLLASLAVLEPVQAVGPGKWTPKVNWGAAGEVAIHMMLLRGDGSPYHSRVLWFGAESLMVFKGGLWGWNPGLEGCTAFPGDSFTALTPPSVGYNVFCSGHSGLADGRMLVAGGHGALTGSYGENKSSIHTTGADTGSGSWSTPSPINTWRWYPTNTTLKDGRVLVTAGYQHRNHWIFGGRLNGSAPTSPQADTVRRWAPVDGGAWDSAVLPVRDATSVPDRPHPCEGHSGTDLAEISPDFKRQTLFFGGKRSDDQAVGDLWVLRREDNVTGSDYSYFWDRRTPQGTAPSARSEHSAVVADGKVVFFGGREGNGTPRSDVLIYNPSGAEGSWQAITIGGELPSARMGHVAVYNELKLNGVEDPVKRMIVYGGVASEGTTPTDMRVFELRFDDPSPGRATWRVMPETTFAYPGNPGDSAQYAPPAPRYWHRAVAGRNEVRLTGNAPFCKIAYVFGGALGNNTYSDSLWMLCLFTTGKYGWVLRNVGGNKPAPRARFSLAYDHQQGGYSGPRLYVHGGFNASGPVDPGIYVIDPYLYGTNWLKWGEAGVSAQGHVSVREGEETHSRYGEIYDPSDGSWTTLSGPLLEHSYPVTFAVSGGSTAGGRVVTASSWDDQTRYLDLPGPGSGSASWQAFPNGSLGFSAEAGVLYRPDKLMIAGGQSGSTVVGTTKTLDASNTSSAWQLSEAMLPRYYHNLVLLPDGKVLVTGGTSVRSDFSNLYPVREPQIWDPNVGSGDWTTPGTLDTSTAVRGYHSTAVLLPDGRVLCAGGWGDKSADPHPDQYRADIYCPPYLFNANGTLANRPVINSAPASLAYGERFTVCLATDTVTLGSMALMRPGMTTHAFDQNQRFVPLTWSLVSTTAGVERRYLVTAPTDPAHAPPGDYLLFVVNGAGTPGIARWVRLGPTSSDTNHPERVLTLGKICSYGESVELHWNPPAADSTASEVCEAPVQTYELRYKLTTMDTWSNFQAGNLATAPDPPGLPGSATRDQATIGGLTPNTRYYFRLISKDYASSSGNWSAMSNHLSFMTHYEECGGFAGGGGGGGGSAMELVAGSAGLRPEGVVSAGEENTLLANVPAGQTRTDRLLLPAGPEWAGSVARVRLARSGTRSTHVERVKLLAVDHAPGTEVIPRDGELLVGTRSAPLTVAHADGRDLQAMLGAGGGFAGAEEDTVLVAIGAPGPGALALSTEGAHLVLPPSQTGIEVQSRVEGAWLTVGWHHPRARGDSEVFEVPERSSVRLVFHGVHRLLEVGAFAGTAASGLMVHEPTTVTHSHSSAGLAELAADGISLHPGESLHADFAAEPGAAEVQRSWFLEVTGSHGLAGTEGVQAKLEGAQGLALPARFALRQNRPNPLSGTTTIDFDVPRRARVQVSVFDLLGRHIAVLTDREFAPGQHQLAWDRRDRHGRTVRAGVYVYRLVAEGHREQRTMVVIP